MSIVRDLNVLQGDIAGEVIEPSDQAYQQSKEVFYSGYNERLPIAVVRPADSSDVARVVRFVGDSSLDLAVRGGGHSVLGHGISDGGLVLDMSDLDDIEIDVDSRQAWAGGGVLAGEYTSRTAEHGLVTGFGDTGTVGIAGLTLGGGVGFLHRKLGLTIDSLLGAEMVTADGEIRVIDDQADPDLFWAIRGGGGNFGVVTRLQYRLHPVDTVVGGMVILPATPELITDFVTASLESSDDLSVITGIMVAPPMPFLPKEVHGELVVVGMMVHAGDTGVGEVEVDRFRKLATPLFDGLDVMPYTQMYSEEGGPPQPAAMSVRSVFSDEFTIDDGEAVVEGLRSSTAAMSVTQIRVLGGEVARIPSDATAFAHRDRSMIVNVAAAYQDTSQRPGHEAWAEGLSSQLRQGAPGAYLNFLGDDSPTVVRNAYPSSTWERLIEVKRKYDPQNLFASNHNIRTET